ncbi:MAG: DUF4349 domain-containing protein [Gemmatimonadaceae bacterium]
MRKHIRTRAAIVLALSLAACSQKENSIAADRSADAVVTADVAPTAPPVAEARAMSLAKADGSPGSAAAPAPVMSFGSGALPSAIDASGAMLVRQGEASIQVHRIADGVTKVRETAAQYGGFVANTTLRTGREDQRGAKLEVRIPTAQFDALLAALGTLGKVESVTASAQDVGEEYVDIGARAANARRVEARLVEMLSSRAGKLSEVLTVEQELTRVREEIERYDARVRFLERRASMSTLSITLHEPLGIIDNPRPGPLAEAAGIAWERMVGALAWCVASLGVLVPLLVLVGMGAVVMRAARNRFGTVTAEPEG